MKVFFNMDDFYGKIAVMNIIVNKKLVTKKALLYGFLGHCSAHMYPKIFIRRIRRFHEKTNFGCVVKWA